MALGLRALRKVTGHIGGNVKPVFWKGMVENDDRSIILDPEVFKGYYPIDHQCYDILVGQIVHEGFLSIEFGEWVKSKVTANAWIASDHLKLFLEKMVDTAESIFISELVKPYIWSRYLESYFKNFHKADKRDPELPPSPQSLADAWMHEALYHQADDNRHFYYDEPIRILSDHVRGIRAVANGLSLSSRREERIALYGQMWIKLQEVLSQWEYTEADRDGVNLRDDAGPKGETEIGDYETENMENGESPYGEQKLSDGLAPELAEDVSLILEDGSMVNQSIAVALQEPGARSMETRIHTGEIKTDIEPDKLQVVRLKKIFKRQDLLIRQLSRKKIRRGLSEGKLDPMRLHRVVLDGKVFKYNQGLDTDHRWHISIVADASASMAGNDTAFYKEKRIRRPWEIAEKSFVSLAAAAKGHRNRLDIYAYQAEKNICHLTRLYHGNDLYTVTPAGRTPSGQAIMTAASLMENRFRKSMIVHITDGAANCGLSLGDALDYCRKSHIDVFTLGCGCNRQTRDFLREFFPSGHLYFLKSVDYLADGLAYLFQRKILKSIR